MLFTNPSGTLTRYPRTAVISTFSYSKTVPAQSCQTCEQWNGVFGLDMVAGGPLGATWDFATTFNNPYTYHHGGNGNCDATWDDKMGVPFCDASSFPGCYNLTFDHLIQLELTALGHAEGNLTARLRLAPPGVGPTITNTHTGIVHVHTIACGLRAYCELPETMEFSVTDHSINIGDAPCATSCKQTGTHLMTVEFTDWVIRPLAQP